MSVFISWSGPRSKHIAAALGDWLPHSIHGVKPWMSEKVIRSGDEWRSEVRQQLNKSNVSIIYLTPENTTSEWLLCESGALSKVGYESDVQAAQVITYLHNLEPTDISGPLAQYQARVTTKNDTRRVVLDINEALPANEKEESQLVEDAFEKFWPDLEKAIQATPLLRNETEPPRRESDEKIDELLTLVRELSLGRRTRYARPPAPIYLGKNIDGTDNLLPRRVFDIFVGQNPLVPLADLAEMITTNMYGANRRTFDYTVDTFPASEFSADVRTFATPPDSDDDLAKTDEAD